MDKFSNWQEILVTNYEQFIFALKSYSPKLLEALALIIAALVLATLSRWLIRRLGQGADRIVQRFSPGTRYFHLRWPVSRVLGGIVYWVIILFFITSAARSLGLPGITSWLERFIVYLPSVLFALFIIWVGFVLGTFSRERLSSVISENNLKYAGKIGNLARILIITLFIIIALGQIGIDVRVIEQLLVVITTAVALALALAFGLGAGSTVTNIIAIRNLRKHYQKGQRVRVEGMEGEILEIANISVILDTKAGRAMIPAKIFQEQASILLDDNSLDER